MSMTVTATGTPGSFADCYLLVKVLDSAVEAGGASASGVDVSGGSSDTFSLTPNHSNSLPVWVLTADSTEQAFTVAASNTGYAASAVDSDDWSYQFGYYSGTVTASTPITCGASATGASDNYTWAGYEIEPSGGSTPTVDASSPALVSAASVCTTASFTPPAGSVLVALFAVSSTGIDPCSATVSGGGLTWTQRAGASGAEVQCGFIFTATVPAAGVAVAAPRQQPGPARRRVPARAYARFTPVSTANAAAVAISGRAQPRATVPVPRRPRARAVWRGITGPAYVAVRAPRQQCRTPPRRPRARAVWRGITGPAYVAVRAPRQQCRTPPRRVPARACVRFIPVTTVNAAAATPALGTVQPRATVPVPRRPRARAVWRGITGPAYVAVPAPAQQCRTPPRRLPARALWRGITGPAYVAVPAPRQQCRTPPRRPLARAVWRRITGAAPAAAVPAPRQQCRALPRRPPARAYARFTPVATVNAVPSRALIVSLASAAGTDDYGNTYPQGIQIGPASNKAQIQLIPTIPDGNAAELAFPMPGTALSNVPGIIGGVTGGPYVDLEISGPALAASGEQDWVQLNLFSDLAYESAAMDFRYIAPGGGVTVTAVMDSGGWTFNSPVTFSDPVTFNGGVTFNAGATITGGLTVDSLDVTGGTIDLAGGAASITETNFNMNPPMGSTSSITTLVSEMENRGMIT